MINWYYVMGSERIGPVDAEVLKKLFLKNEINLETYVWKKGFQNWERLKNVSELKMDVAEKVNNAPIVPVVTPPAAPLEKLTKVKNASEGEEDSPEVKFSFNWKKVDENSETFFVKIGKDRKKVEGPKFYGPYSLVELREAIKAKRINYQTLIYTPGMSSWMEVSDTPLNESFKESTKAVTLNEYPLILFFNHSPKPICALLKQSGPRENILLGENVFSNFENKVIKATLYVGNEVKAKNVKVKIVKYDKLNQSIKCYFQDLNQDTKKIILNHAV